MKINSEELKNQKQKLRKTEIKKILTTNEKILFEDIFKDIKSFKNIKEGDIKIKGNRIYKWDRNVTKTFGNSVFIQEDLYSSKPKVLIFIDHKDSKNINFFNSLMIILGVAIIAFSVFQGPGCHPQNVLRFKNLINEMRLQYVSDLLSKNWDIFEKYNLLLNYRESLKNITCKNF